MVCAATFQANRGSESLLYLANERCAILLAVDPQIEERRLQLRKEQASLQKACEWLQTLTKDVPGIDGETGMDRMDIS